MAIFYDSVIIYFTLVGSYVATTLIGYMVDTNHVFEDHKIKKRTKEEYKILYRKCLPCLIKNVGILSFPYIFCTAYLNNYIYGGYSVYDYNYKILNILKFILYYMASYFITDVVFYTGHRLMHTKYLYKYHKKHHEIKNPVTIATLYMHPVDLYVSNLSPVAVSVLLLNLNIITIQILVIIQICFSVLFAHGGYKEISLNHNIHHTLFNYNYGLGFCMDKLFKTEYIEPLINIVDSPHIRKRQL